MPRCFDKRPLSNFKLLVLFLFVFPFLGFFFQNCAKLEVTSTFEGAVDGSSEDPDEPAPAPDFDLIPHAAFISPGGQVQLQTLGSKATGVVYQLAAGDGTLSSNGLFTAPASGNRDIIVGAQNSEGVWVYSFIRVSSGSPTFAVLPTATLVPARTTFGFGKVGGVGQITYSLSSTEFSSIDAATGVLTTGDEKETLNVFAIDSVGSLSMATVVVDPDAGLAMPVLMSPTRLNRNQSVSLVIGGGYGSPVLSLRSGGATLSGNQITAGNILTSLMVRITDSGQQQLNFNIPIQ